MKIIDGKIIVCTQGNKKLTSEDEQAVREWIEVLKKRKAKKKLSSPLTPIK